MFSFCYFPSITVLRQWDAHSNVLFGAISVSKCSARKFRFLTNKTQQSFRQTITNRVAPFLHSALTARWKPEQSIRKPVIRSIRSQPIGRTTIYIFVEIKLSRWVSTRRLHLPNPRSHPLSLFFTSAAESIQKCTNTEYNLNLEKLNRLKNPEVKIFFKKLQMIDNYFIFDRENSQIYS